MGLHLKLNKFSCLYKIIFKKQHSRTLGKNISYISSLKLIKHHGFAKKKSIKLKFPLQINKNVRNDLCNHQPIFHKYKLKRLIEKLLSSQIHINPVVQFPIHIEYGKNAHNFFQFPSNNYCLKEIQVVSLRALTFIHNSNYLKQISNSFEITKKKPSKFQLFTET